MKSYFVALTPNDRIRAEVAKTKLMIFERFGNQRFLLDKPHSTLYVGLAEDLKEVETRLEKIISNQKIIKVEIDNDWQEFKEDKLAGGGTNLALKFAEENKRHIINLQKKVVNSLNELRKNKIHIRYKNMQLSNPFMESIGKYGYPFVSSNEIKDILIPHISFCCFKLPKNAEKFKELCDIKKFVGPAEFPKLSLYNLYPDDKTGLIRHFSLQ